MIHGPSNVKYLDFIYEFLFCFRVYSKIRYLVLIFMPYIEAPAYDIFRIPHNYKIRSPIDLNVFCCFVLRQFVNFSELNVFTFSAFIFDFFRIISENIDPFLYFQKYYSATN